jgi:hypothetical protein
MQRLRMSARLTERPDRRFWSVPGVPVNPSQALAARRGALKSVNGHGGRPDTRTAVDRLAISLPTDAGRTKPSCGRFDQHRPSSASLWCFAKAGIVIETIGRNETQISVLKDCGLSAGGIDPHGPKESVEPNGRNGGWSGNCAGLAAPRSVADAGAYLCKPRAL